MLGWTTRDVGCTGAVLFRGTLPPRLDEFTQLAASQVRVRPTQASAEVHWSAELEHPQWGRAEVMCPRRHVPVPRELVAHDPRLDDTDRAAALAAGSTVAVRMRATQRHVLRDRKRLLRFLRCLTGDDALIADDLDAQKFWSREALDDELQHDADLDVESLFISHLVHDGDDETDVKRNDPPAAASSRPPHWLHTHGLAALGARDFDILRPSELIVGAGYDVVRAVAFHSLEGNVDGSTRRFAVILPGGFVSFVDVAEFNRRAPAAARQLRGDPDDPDHNRDRLILCDPRPGRLRAWLPGAGTPRPSRLLSTIDDDNMTCHFSRPATELMAERARKTFDVFRRLSAEFEELQVKPLVKLGYTVDGGAQDEREHMWFEVHGFGGASVDATLLNNPFGIRAMKAGDRAEHALEQLTDWTIITPAGPITPREMCGARALRLHREEIMRLIASSPPPVS